MALPPTAKEVDPVPQGFNLILLVLDLWWRGSWCLKGDGDGGGQMMGRSKGIAEPSTQQLRVTYQIGTTNACYPSDDGHRGHMKTGLR